MVNKKFTISPTLSFFLNIFRVFAAWSVLFGHCFTGFKKTIFQNQLYFPYLQNIGVVLLFLLSGFLSAYSFYRKKDDSSYNFTIYFIEKSCRIGIGLFPALIFVAILDRITISISPEKYLFYENYNFKSFLGTLLNLQNFFTVPKEEAFVFLSRFNIAQFGTARPLWTLSVEWWIYMAIGYTVLELIPSSKNNHITIMQFLIAFIICWQPAEFLFGVRGPNLVFIWFLGYLIFYIFLAITNTSNKQTQKTLPLVLYALSSIALFIFFGISIRTAYAFLVVLSAGNCFLSLLLLIDKITMPPTQQIKELFSKLASYTYSLYLIHTPVMCFFLWNTPKLNSFQQFWVTVFTSHLVSILLYYGFERFGKRLSRYLITQYRSTRP